MNNTTTTTKHKSKKWLYQMYWVKKLTVVEIAKECDAGSTTVLRWMNRLGIERRGKGEHMLGNKPWNKGRIGEYHLWENTKHPQTGKPRTKDERKKISQKLKGKEFSKETRHKISEANTGRVMSEDVKNRISEKLKGHTLTEQQRKKHLKNIKRGKSHPMYGRKHTLEARKKISENLIGRIPSPKCNRGKRERYKGISMRSSYELAYAKWLDQNKIKWEYEPLAFPINIGKKITTYTPDFYLIETKEYIQIKGYMYPEAKKKIDKFEELYMIKHTILYRDDLLKLGIKIN